MNLNAKPQLISNSLSTSLTCAKNLKVYRVAALSACFGLGLSMQLGAQAETLLQAHDLAKVNDPKFRAAQAEARARETATDQAWAGYKPQVKLEYDSQKTQQKILSSNNPVFQAGSTSFPTTSYTISVTQPLYRKDLLERIDQAEVVVREARVRLLAAEQDLLLRTSTAYLSVLAANDALLLARAERLAVGRTLDFARERLKAGLGTITEQHDASARFAVAQAREIEAQYKLNDAKQSVREITQMPLKTFQTLRDDFSFKLPEPNQSQQWVEAALGQNLGLRALKEATEIARIEVDRLYAGHYPSVSLIYSYGQRNSGSTLFGGGSNVQTGDFFVRLNVPIYEGGMTSSLVAEAVQKLTVAQENEEQERRAVDRKALAAFEGVVSGIGLVQALKQSVVSQESALEAKTVGQQAGRFTLLAVLDAERDLFMAKRDYAQARYVYLLNVLKLKDAAGTLSEADLATVHAALQ